MSNDERIAILETTMNHIDTNLEGIREDIKFLSERINIQLTRLDNDVKAGLKDVNNRLWTNFTFTLGVCAGVFAIMAHGFHWF